MHLVVAIERIADLPLVELGNVVAEVHHAQRRIVAEWRGRHAQRMNAYLRLVCGRQVLDGRVKLVRQDGLQHPHQPRQGIGPGAIGYLHVARQRSGAGRRNRGGTLQQPDHVGQERRSRRDARRMRAHGGRKCRLLPQRDAGTIARAIELHLLREHEAVSGAAIETDEQRIVGFQRGCDTLQIEPLLGNGARRLRLRLAWAQLVPFVACRQ